VAEAEGTVTYNIHKATEKAFMSKGTKEITSVNITLTKIL